MPPPGAAGSGGGGGGGGGASLGDSRDIGISCDACCGEAVASSSVAQPAGSAQAGGKQAPTP